MYQAPGEFVEKYYLDDLAERESVESRWSFAWLKEVKGRSVLSVGCGPNFFDDVQFFDKVPTDFVGIDINKNNIEFLKQSKHPEVLKWKNFLADSGVKTEVLVRDVKAVSPDFIGRFDTIYAIGVLGMFDRDDTIKVFKNLNQYLKPGGRVLDLDWTDSRLPEEKLKERESFDWYSKRGPSVAEIGELFAETGFKILKHEVYNVPNPADYGWGKIYGYLAEKI